MLSAENGNYYKFNSHDIELYNKMIDMQYQFNFSIGKDHKSQEYKTYIEVYNLLQALSDEIVEAKNCFNWKWWSKEGKEHPQFNYIFDVKNYQIELIDSLRFILSINILADVKINEFTLLNVYLNEMKVDNNNEIRKGIKNTILN